MATRPRQRSARNVSASTNPASGNTRAARRATRTPASNTTASSATSADGEYGPDLVSDFALKFIEKNKSKPFFLYYPMMLTHAPYQPTPDSPDWDPKARGEQVNRDNKHFADMVAYMDKLVGKVVTKLDDLKLRDNTIILFLGDNGTGKGVNSKLRGVDYPAAKAKPTPAACTSRSSPTGPATSTPARTTTSSTAPTSSRPSAQPPAPKFHPPLKIDGHSFWPQLMGEKGEPREWIYTWYAQDGVAPIREFVTTKEYKLYRGGRFYDLKKDPFEDNDPKNAADLTGDEAKAAAKLKAVLAQFADARPAEVAAKSQAAKKGGQEDERPRQGRTPRPQSCQKRE